MKINLNELIGQKYGRLTIIEAKRNEKYVIIVKAKCECGNIKEYQYAMLKNGKIRSCGCYHHQIIKKHGDTRTKLYKIWSCIKDRCYNIKSNVFNRYGGRGIKMCNEWYNDFIAFKKWSLENGYKEGLSIDRINNNDNYEPNNCRWTTVQIQNNNKRNNRYITINDETKTLAEWCRFYNISYDLVHNRLRKNWDILVALTTPKKVVVKGGDI